LAARWTLAKVAVAVAKKVHTWMGKFDALKHTQTMAKKIKNLAVKQTEASVRVDKLFNNSRKVDPALASLFAGSASNRKIS
jgi:phage terminase large subunit-like protein